MRNWIVWISAFPELQSLDVFFALARHQPVIADSRDVKLFAFADPVAQLKSLLRRGGGEITLPDVRIGCRQPRVSNREVLIEFNRALEKRNRVGVTPFQMIIKTNRICVECFE